MTATLIDPAEKLTVKRLYGAKEVAAMLGTQLNWVLKHMRNGGPPPDFCVQRGGKMAPLWSPVSIDRWRAYHASSASLPKVERYLTFSDHNAVNQVGGLMVTWKLWWRNTYDGGAMWWFSTPDGWYVSDDDGRTWDFADTMVRPGGYHYFSVNGNVNPNRAVAGILRTAHQLKQRLEAAREAE